MVLDAFAVGAAWIRRSLSDEGVLATVGGLRVVEVCNKETEKYATWMLVRDSSVGCGVELVSRILTGEHGLKEVGDVVKEICAIKGVGVGPGCGLHVHLSCEGYTGEEIKQTVVAFMYYEKELDRVFPKERQGDRCRHARSNSVSCKTPLRELYKGHHDLDTFIHIATPPHGHHSTIRYHKLNLAHLPSRLEFRSHPSTLSPHQATSWVTFLDTFTNSAKRVFTFPPPPSMFDLIQQAGYDAAPYREWYAHLSKLSEAAPAATWYDRDVDRFLAQ